MGINTGRSNGRLQLMESEFQEILQLYKDPSDSEFILWRLFEADIEIGKNVH
jgi:hypothetical protein